MKKFLNIKRTMALSLAFATFLSCNGLDDGNTIPVPDANIIEIAKNKPNLSSLVGALERANLSTILQGTDKFTVLAPDNTAFNNFLGGAGFGSVDDVPVETLRQLLLNHMFAVPIESAAFRNLQRNYAVNAADGPTTGTNLVTYFDATSGVTFNGVSSVTEADVAASNGIIHVVDAVIPIPTIDTFISVDDNLKDLETAIDIVSPLSTLPGQLSESDSGPFTVFAPIEHAFDNLLDDNIGDTNGEWDSLSDIDETFLTAVIAHHVLEGNVRSTDISFGQSLTTLEGDIITFSNVDGNIEITDGAGNSGSVIGVFDIQAINGVIHILPAQVLIPDTTN